MLYKNVFFKGWAVKNKTMECSVTWCDDWYHKKSRSENAIRLYSNNTLACGTCWLIFAKCFFFFFLYRFQCNFHGCHFLLIRFINYYLWMISHDDNPLSYNMVHLHLLAHSQPWHTPSIFIFTNFFNCWQLFLWPSYSLNYK